MSNVFFTRTTEVTQALIARLQAEGHKTTVLAPETVATYTDAVKAAIKDADIVIHTPTVFDLEAQQSEYTTVDTIINALEGTQKTLILASNTWVLGDTGKVLAEEKTPVAPITLVAPLAQLEDKVIQAAKKGIRSIVIRHANVFGFKGDFVHEYLETAIREKTAYFTGNGENKFSVVALEDLVDLYARAIAKGTAGDIYHAANGKAWTTKEFAETAGKVVGVQKTQGLSAPELKIKYGALAEALNLNQQITFDQTKERLQWTPKVTEFKTYIEQVEKELATAVR